MITGVWKLKNDVVGVLNQEIFGKAGDWVEVIADHDPVVIVRAEGGERYPVPKTNLTQGNILPVENTLEKLETPVPVKHKKKAARKPVTSPAPSAKQQEFFT